MSASNGKANGKAQAKKTSTNGALSAKWKNELKRERGKFVACSANVISILSNDPAWAGVLAFNEFTGTIVKLRTPPWHDHDKPKKDGIPWVEQDATRTQAWLTRQWNITVPITTVEDAVKVVADQNLMHPVRDWLNSLKWDKRPRLDDWLVKFGGADNTPYTKAVGSMFLISAVARVMEPGCKVDHTLVLEGGQGIGKSSLLRELAGEEWFLETSIELGSKDSYQILLGKWIVEMPELDSFSRSELTRVKSFLTVRVDSYRPSYGRVRRDFPRHCVFAGTTNEDEYLKDDTGARRFWPVRCTGVTPQGKVDIAALRKAREQLWAEAVFRYKKGELWYVTDKKLAGIFEQEQERRHQSDPWEPLIAKWLFDHPRRWTDVGVGDILERALQIEPKDRTRYEEIRVGNIMRRLGWERTRARVGGVLVYVYTPLPQTLRAMQRDRDRLDRETKVKSEGKLRNLSEKLVNKPSRERRPEV